ncbi:MAG: acetate kinase [Bacteroidota bacterium]
MKILVLNCGSSSIKYQLIDMTAEPDVLAKGLLERVGINDSELKHQPTGKDDFKLIQDVPDHTIGINLIIDALMHPEHGVIKDKYEIKAVGHRVVHGGEKFSGSVRITQDVIDMMEECVALAPLHNPANLKGIYAIQKLLPEVEQCGIFDTSFHATMPEHAYMYAISYDMYEKYRIRRYGFHGTSHRYVSKKACDLLKMDYNNSKIITCHLGNGASIAAIHNGKSVDTSMGLTPVEGLIMGTRCGDLDLGVMVFMMEKEGLDYKAVNNYINKNCGMLGISGVSSDMRDLYDASAKGNKRAELALQMYAYRVKKYIGSYAAAMGGVDIIVYTGGIGENDYLTRQRSCDGLEYMGVEFDTVVNDKLRGKDAVLSTPSSKVKVVTVGTNEELVIAMDTMEIVSSKK